MSLGRPLRRPRAEPDDDPLSGVANFFDLGIVFALGFMLALIAYTRLEARSPKPAGEPVPQANQTLDRYRPGTGQSTGRGQRLGIAWRLESGEVVYVPDTSMPDTPPTPSKP